MLSSSLEKLLQIRKNEISQFGFNHISQKQNIFKVCKLCLMRRLITYLFSHLTKFLFYSYQDPQDGHPYIGHAVY